MSQKDDSIRFLDDIIYQASLIKQYIINHPEESNINPGLCSEIRTIESKIDDIYTVYIDDPNPKRKD